MGKEQKIFKNEERRSRADVSAFLGQLAEKVAGGNLVLRQGGQEISLDLPHNLILEIQVEEEDKKSKGTQYSLEVEIKWFEGDDFGGPLELG